MFKIQTKNPFSWSKIKDKLGIHVEKINLPLQKNQFFYFGIGF